MLGDREYYLFDGRACGGQGTGDAMMNTFNIYIEGHRATGDCSSASFICAAEGENFSDACHSAWMQGLFKGYGDFNPERLTLWGCHLFDNLKDAQRSFG